MLSRAANFGSHEGLLSLSAQVALAELSICAREAQRQRLSLGIGLGRWEWRAPTAAFGRRIRELLR